jgi:hypothetical protein
MQLLICCSKYMLLAENCRRTRTEDSAALLVELLSTRPTKWPPSLLLLFLLPAPSLTPRLPLLLLFFEALRPFLHPLQWLLQLMLPLLILRVLLLPKPRRFSQSRGLSQTWRLPGACVCMKRTCAGALLLLLLLPEYG